MIEVTVYCLNFQYNHYFETTYGSGYNTTDTSKVPEALKLLEGKNPRFFKRDRFHCVTYTVDLKGFVIGGSTYWHSIMYYD